MPDTVLVHMRFNKVSPLAIRSNFFDVKTFVISAVPVWDAVLEEVQSRGEIQALAPF